MSRLPAGIVVAAAVLLAGGAAPAEGHPADVCLEVTPGAATAEEWSAVAAAVGETVAGRPLLFPYPSLDLGASRLDSSSGPDGQARGHAPCLEPGRAWTARFGRDFLEAGAERMLAEAPTTPGIDSEVSIEWHPDETRLRTVLVFAGPLDIPSGTCWVDDALTVEAGVVTASGERGLETSLFAEGACGRFYDHLPGGGAGEQAVTLLPADVGLAEGAMLRFVAEEVSVRDDAVLVMGSLARD